MVWHKQMCMCRLTDKFLCIMLHWLDSSLTRQRKFVLKLTRFFIKIPQKVHIRLNHSIGGFYRDFNVHRFISIFLSQYKENFFLGQMIMLYFIGLL